MSGNTQVDDAIQALLKYNYENGGGNYTAKHLLAEVIAEATRRLVLIREES